MAVVDMTEGKRSLLHYSLQSQWCVKRRRFRLGIRRLDWRKAGLKRAELREAYWTGSGCITLEEQRIKHNKEKEAENLRL